MPATVPTVQVGELIQVTIYAKADTQFSANVFHYVVTAIGVPAARDQDVVDFLDTQLNPNFKLCMSNQASYWGMTAQVIKPVKRSPVMTTISRGVGGQVGDLLPRQSAGVIKLSTGIAGRSLRGRKYIPFPAESDNGADGRPIAAYVTRLQTLAGQFDDTQNVLVGGRSCTLDPVVFSRKNNTGQVIATATARTNWGTQRRRSAINRPDTDPLAV